MFGWNTKEISERQVAGFSEYFWRSLLVNFAIKSVYFRYVVWICFSYQDQLQIQMKWNRNWIMLIVSDIILGPTDPRSAFRIAYLFFLLK